jgi:hypothetical protein
MSNHSQEAAQTALSEARVERRSNDSARCDGSEAVAEGDSTRASMTESLARRHPVAHAEACREVRGLRELTSARLPCRALSPVREVLDGIPGAAGNGHRCPMALMFPLAPEVAVSTRHLVAGGRLVQRELVTHEGLGNAGAERGLRTGQLAHEVWEALDRDMVLSPLAFYVGFREMQRVEGPYPMPLAQVDAASGTPLNY